MKKIVSFMLAVVMILAMTGCGDTAAKTVKTSDGSEIQNGEWNSFVFTVTDENRKAGDTTETLKYQVFVPYDYDSSQSYPMVAFVPDASVKQIGTTKKQDGAKVWTTQEEQAKHPAFVLVVGFTANPLTTDSSEFDAQGEYLEDIIMEVAENFNIDMDRLYMTGQSQGGMTSFWYNINRSDLFAATIYVACQWDTTGMDTTIVNDKFFYIVSDGDIKAGPGQLAVQEVLKNAGVNYSYADDLVATDSEAVESAVEEMLKEGNAINMLRYRQGTVNNGDIGNDATEHSGTWAYAYTISAVRDWLFEQSK